MPTEVSRATLNDIGTEELAHLEMVGAMVHQLTKGVPAKELEKLGLGAYYSDHDHAVYPISAAGSPFTAAYVQSKGDVIADLTEDLAAEQKARATYENLINLADDPDVIDPLRFLREREVVHFQRFGETLRLVQENMAEKKFFMNANMNFNNTNNMGVLSGNMPMNNMPIGILPTNTGTMPSNMGTAPLKTGTMPANMGTMPANTGTMPANMGTMPTNTGTMPANMGTMPANTGTMPANMGTMPANTGKKRY
jgi:spore coat protein JC